MVLPKQARFWSGVTLLLAGLAGATLQVSNSFAAPAARKAGLLRPRFPVQPTLGSNIAMVSSPTGGDGIPQDTNSIAISPFNLNLLIGAYNQFSGPIQQVGVALSQNNGQSWSNTVVPGNQLGLGAGAGPSYDPGTAADKAGFRYVVYGESSLIQDISGIFVTKYDQSGAAVSLPVADSRVYVSGPGFDNLQHAPKIAAANSNSSAQNNLYVTWVNDEGPGSNIVFKRHLPVLGGGWLPGPSTFSTISDVPGDYQFPDVAAGPGQEVYVAWFDHGTGTLMVDTSLDAGASFPFADVVAAVLDKNAFHTPIPAAPHGDSMTQGGISSYPAIDVDRSNGPNLGTIYIAYADNREDFTGFSSGYDIWVVRSTDQGATWSPPVRVNDDTPGIPVDQFQPWLSVDGVTGDVDVSWYDTRNSPLAPIPGTPYQKRLRSDVFFARSLDGGVTFTPNIPVTEVQSFPGNASPVPFPGGPVGGYQRDYGDYSGLAAYLNFVFPNWTDFRHGNGVDQPLADPDPYTVRLIAGTGEQLGPLPTSLDFGTVCPGQTVTRTFQLCNLGSTPLAIPSLTASGTGFSLRAAHHRARRVRRRSGELHRAGRRHRNVHGDDQRHHQ